MIDPASIERHLDDAVMFLHNDGSTDRAQREARRAIDLMEQLDAERRVEETEASGS